MNWKMTIRAAFDLTDEEWDQAVKLRALSEPERELLMTALGPQKPAARKSSKTTRVYERCARCGKTKGHGFHKDSSNDGYHLFQSPPQPIKTAGKKSARAQSLGEQLRQRQTIKGNAAICTDCDYGSDHNIHHLESMTGHHPFQPAASSAPLPSDQASSEIGSESVGVVAQGAD